MIPKVPPGPRLSRRSHAEARLPRQAIASGTAGEAVKPHDVRIDTVTPAPAAAAAAREGNVTVSTAVSAHAPSPAIEEPATPSRFRIFIIDSGWNSAARRVLHENFALMRDLQNEDPIYVLGKEKSIELIRRHPSLMGKDPIIAVHDQAAMDKGGTTGFHGFRLHLGLLRRPEQALLALQAFTRFLNTHRQSADLEADIRANLRREGIAGAIEIILHHEAREIGE